MHLELKPNDYILLPEYICDVVLDPLRSLGIKHIYYSVDDRLQPRWNELPNKINNRTKAIVMIHYFGQPQNIPVFQSFCNEHNLLLIEDNAHGHGGMIKGKMLGTFGDMGISSPRKSLSTYCGGVLYINSDQFNCSIDLSAHPISLRKRMGRVLSLYPEMKNIINKAIKKCPKFEDLRAFKEPMVGDYLIDKWSEKIIRRIDWKELRKKRQVIYHEKENIAIENKLTPIFNNLHAEANPWCFPAYAKDQAEAIKWLEWGWEKNEPVFCWPSLMEEVIIKNGESLNRRKRLICFGIV